MGQLRFSSLATATSQFKDPTYRLELDVDQGTASALRRLLETGPLRGTDGARLPILGRTARSVDLMTFEQPTPAISSGQVNTRSQSKDTAMSI